MGKYRLKTISIAEVLVLSALVAFVWIRNDIIVALGFAVAIISGRIAVRRYIIKAGDHKKGQSPNKQREE